MITKDEDTKTYFLTRLGLNSLQLIQKFLDITKEYDMNDVNAEGHVIKLTKIIGRKVVNL